METLNKQIYRMKSMMGILGESFDWDFANEKDAILFTLRWS